MKEVYNLSELVGFKTKNPYIVNAKNRIDFKAAVRWEIKGKIFNQETNISVSWEQNGLNSGNVIVDAGKPQDASRRYFKSLALNINNMSIVLRRTS
ncbi:MAG: hypothetical protein NC548_27985 [Lachnospiraceae bacterium]|nr:hypothetical protein [Lachnospiraceae bacterium]